MTTTAQARRDLYERLLPTLGESTDTLMELLPLHPTPELATREDVLANATVLRGEMAELRGELRGEMAELRGELRGEMAELRAELRGEMVELRFELQRDMAQLEGRIETQLTQSHAEMTLLVSGLRDEFVSRRANTAWTILGTAVAVLAAVLAYIQLLGL